MGSLLFQVISFTNRVRQHESLWAADRLDVKIIVVLLVNKTVL